MPAASSRRALVTAAAALAALLALAGGVGAASPPSVTLLAVGDVASCDSEADERVASLLARTRGTIALLGDVVYDSGTAAEVERCFLPAFGPLLGRIRAALGNHDYGNGAGRADAVKRALGLGASWYSYELGAWHVVVLDSNCALVDGCGPGSRQWGWLRRDLERHRSTRCTLAYWHHARFSSGREHGPDDTVEPLWRLLARARADVVLAGHDHDYERFAPIDGMRSFVVGTGGRSLRPVGEPQPRSVARQSESYGVLRLSLRRGDYAWRFLTAAGPPYADAGNARCR